MYFAVVVGNIQGNSRFTVAEGESRYSTLAESGMLVPNKNSVKRFGGIFAGLKNAQGVVTIIYVFVIQNSNHAFLHILHQFY